ncbi:type VI secretion system contractile sheath small subunit [Desulfonauticus submarinus]|uniref:Type VI secretion system protein ImpB n=1 Tax=Desulfonauticus submarinus TaxID=206665 RepID=A0A1G9ZU61_9BACT|nr:type VI secretion system contractile sheath small subunit [Desulfonauticus submarinus]SDN24665.1 type VI secretion system protein ImpB [Desulfonauticus submarinus]
MEGSIAPKERVNITYKPATGDAQEEVELPLKLLIMGDFTLQEDERMVEDREPISIDKNNFNDVLKAHNLELQFTVPNKLSDNEEDEELSVNLKFEHIRDFDPDNVVKQVPELARLMELREALVALKGPLGNIPEFRKKLQKLIEDPGTREKILKELNLDKE